MGHLPPRTSIQPSPSLTNSRSIKVLLCMKQCNWIYLWTNSSSSLSTQDESRTDLPISNQRITVYITYKVFFLHIFGKFKQHTETLKTFYSLFVQYNAYAYTLYCVCIFFVFFTRNVISVFHIFSWNRTWVDSRTWRDKWSNSRLVFVYLIKVF